MPSLNRIVSLLIVSISLFLVSLARAEDSSFTNWDYKFRISIPEAFQAEKDPAPNVGVLVKNKEHGYPTFNVVIVPGLYKAGTLAPQKQLDLIAKEYVSVGIPQPRVISSSQSKISDRNAFTAVLEYGMGDQILRSSVTKISGVTSHFILTFVDTADKFDASPLNECSNGIHFFITKKEAIRWAKEA